MDMAIRMAVEELVTPDKTWSSMVDAAIAEDAVL